MCSTTFVAAIDEMHGEKPQNMVRSQAGKLIPVRASRQYATTLGTYFSDPRERVTHAQ